jgi:hypothetical protein
MDEHLFLARWKMDDFGITQLTRVTPSPGKPLNATSALSHSRQDTVNTWQRSQQLRLSSLEQLRFNRIDRLNAKHPHSSPHSPKTVATVVLCWSGSCSPGFRAILTSTLTYTHLKYVSGQGGHANSASVPFTAR